MKIEILAMISVIVIVLVTTIVIDQERKSTLKKVKEGSYQLFCKLSKEGYVEVDKDKVLTRQDDVWIFDNGYSRNCKVLKK